MMTHEMWAGMLAGAMLSYFAVGLIAIWLLPMVFYLLSMQSALEAVRASNRRFAPGLVWLNLIPLFNLVWNFFVVNAVSGSLQREFAERGVRDVGDCGHGIGIAMSILAVLTLVPVLGWSLASIVTLVLWILYWVKIVELKNRLQGLQREGMPT